MQKTITTQTYRFQTVKIILAGYAAIGLLLLLIDAALAATGHGAAVDSFMWGRSGGVLASGAAFLRFAVAASRGRRSAHVRLRIATIALPVVIVGLMIIPGVAPLWFRIGQLAAAACLVAAAVVINRPGSGRRFA